jgi:MtN3 and saliva related transmembrane protein
MDLPFWTPTLVGSVAAVFTTGAFVPQVVRVWRLKSAGQISLTTFLAFALGTSVWLVYGILIDSIPVIAANAVTLVLSLAIVVLKLNYDRAARRGSPTAPSGVSRRP